MAEAGEGHPGRSGVALDDRVDETVPERLISANYVTADDHLERLLDTHYPWQPLCTADAR